MKNFTQKMGRVLALTSLSLFSYQAQAQCTLTNGSQSVTFSFTPVSLVKPSSCANGYTYNVNVNYTITLGANTNFYGVNGTFRCDNDPSTGFYVGSAGTGSIASYTTSTAKTNCATATPTSMLCGNLTLKANINGTEVNSTCNFQSIATPLPVKLQSFDAALNGAEVQLVWVTAAETQQAYFILERSSNAQDWTALTKMSGQGAERAGYAYHYTDKMPESGMNYYRIKQVDAGGSATYSKILAVAAKKDGQKIAAFPNPNRGETLQFTGLQEPASWSVKVMNAAAAVVYESTSAAQIASMPVLPSGIYYIQLRHAATGEMQTIKLVRN